MFFVTAGKWKDSAQTCKERQPREINEEAVAAGEDVPEPPVAPIAQALVQALELPADAPSHWGTAASSAGRCFGRFLDERGTPRLEQAEAAFLEATVAAAKPEECKTCFWPSTFSDKDARRFSDGDWPTATEASDIAWAMRKQQRGVALGLAGHVDKARRHAASLLASMQTADCDASSINTQTPSLMQQLEDSVTALRDAVRAAEKEHGTTMAFEVDSKIILADAEAFVKK